MPRAIASILALSSVSRSTKAPRRFSDAPWARSRALAARMSFACLRIAAAIARSAAVRVSADASASAAAADFAALAETARAGSIRVATDVFPAEPLAANDPLRRVPNMLFSPHRAGALPSALREIGARVLEDIDLISRGLPPVACRRAERETVARMRSMPVAKS